MVSLFTTALFAATLAGSYDCTLERQVVITESGASNDQVTFPEADQDAWRFGLRVVEGTAPQVSVDWPADPIQIAGTHLSLPLAPGQLALVATAPGPCMFTEEACVAIVELSARDDGSASFSILPAGSVRDAASGSRSLLHVVFLGTCQPQNAAE